MSALLKKRAKERAAAMERRLRGEDVSGDEGGEEVEELSVYKVRLKAEVLRAHKYACSSSFFGGDFRRYFPRVAVAYV